MNPKLEWHLVASMISYDIVAANVQTRNSHSPVVCNSFPLDRDTTASSLVS